MLQQNLTNVVRIAWGPLRRHAETPTSAAFVTRDLIVTDILGIEDRFRVFGESLADLTVIDPEQIERVEAVAAFTGDGLPPTDAPREVLI